MNGINKALFARRPSYKVRREGIEIGSVKLSVTEMPSQDFSTGSAVPNRFDSTIHAFAAEDADIAEDDLITISGIARVVLEKHRMTTHDENEGLFLIVLGAQDD